MLKQRASLLSFVFDKETLVRIFRKHSSVLTLSDLKNVFRELFKAVFRTQVAVFGGIFVNIVKNVGSTKTNLTWQVDCSSLSLSLSLSFFALISLSMLLYLEKLLVLPGGPLMWSSRLLLANKKVPCGYFFWFSSTSTLIHYLNFC